MSAFPKMMSALPPESVHVQLADISKKVCQLFDQLVGASEIDHKFRFEAGFIATSSI